MRCPATMPVMPAILAMMWVGAACDLSLHLDELDTVSLELALGDDTPRVTDMTLQWQAGRCAELSEDVTLSLEAEGLAPVTATDFSFGRRGGWGSGGFAGLPACDNVVLLQAEVTPDLAGADDVAVVLRDEQATATLTAQVASPFVARRAQFSPEPPWPPGTTVAVRWSPTTDTVDTVQVNYLIAEGVRSTGAAGDDALSFTVPEDVGAVRRVELVAEWRAETTCNAPLDCAARGISTIVVEAPIAR